MEAQQTKLPHETGGPSKLSSSFGGGGSVAITPVSGTSKKRDAWGLVQCQYSKDIVQENRAAVNRQIDGFSTKNLADIDKPFFENRISGSRQRARCQHKTGSVGGCGRPGEYTPPADPTKKRRVMQRETRKTNVQWKYRACVMQLSPQIKPGACSAAQIECNFRLCKRTLPASRVWTDLASGTLRSRLRFKDTRYYLRLKAMKTVKTQVTNAKSHIVI